MAKLNKFKTLAAMLYLTRTRAGGVIDYYKLVKMLYFADKAHLQRRGHTVTRDFYVRLEHGSTGSKTLEMLQAVKGEPNKDPRLREFASPHLCVEGTNPYLKVRAFSEPFLDELSPSELAVLDEAYEKIAPLSFSQIKALAHDDAYNARRPEETRDILYEEMAGGDEELIRYLRMIAMSA